MRPRRPSDALQPQVAGRAIHRASRRLALTLAVAAVYVGAGRLGLMLGPVHLFASLVWPPTGISLAALLLGGIELWPGVALGALLVNLWAGAPLAVALGISLGNTLEACAGAYMLRRLGGFQGALDRLRPALVLVAAAVLSTAIAATIGVSSLLMGGQISRGDFTETWRTWWLGDAVGDLVVASLLLAWLGGRRAPARARQVVEAAALCAAVIGACLFIFAWFPASEAARFVEACLLTPLLMWGALAFGMKGATATVFLASAIAVWGTALGRGPFVQATLPESLLFLQSFMAITATTVLLLGAVITDRGQVYEAERESRLRAETAEREAKRLAAVQERLVAMVSHDLRNPLGAIIAGLGIFRRRRGELLEEWEAAILERQARSAARMEEIIRNLLDFARARTGGAMRLRSEPVNMGDVCRQVIAEIEQAEPGRKVSLRVDGDDGGEWDGARMAQVISNLVGNALQHSPEGSPVEVLIRGSARSVVVQVHNSGPPIPADVVAGIFEPFRQGSDGPQGAHVNVGLGLYIVREIVEAHGGTVDVCSRDGKGTRFVVKLPRSSPRPRAARASA